MNLETSSSENELTQDGSFQNDSNQDVANSDEAQEPSSPLDISDDSQVNQKFDSDSIDQNINLSSTVSDSNKQAPDTEARLQQLEKEHETLNGQYMRIAADFDNFRKRQSRDQDDLKLQLTCTTLSEILPVVDNFERARQQLTPEGEEAKALHRSYQGLYKQLVEVLKQLGVAPMRVIDQTFDPTLHEAVMREPSNEKPEDVVIEELQRGYHLNGRVLRHALVKVSMGPGPQTSNDENSNQSDSDQVENNPSEASTNEEN